MTTQIYTIKLSAQLGFRNVFYTAFWNGKRFASNCQPWAALNDEVKAQTEFDRAVKPLKPENWQGNYKVELLAEEWSGDKLLNTCCLSSFKSSNF